jgi:hypothetical protein
MLPSSSKPKPELCAISLTAIARALEKRSPGGLRPVPGASPWKVLHLLRCRGSHFLADETLIPRSSELRRSLPLKGDATPVRPTQSGLEGSTSRTWRHAARGKGHGEEDIWKAWLGDHRLGGCRGDRGQPIDCGGCLGEASAFGQRGCSGSGPGVRLRQLGRS